TDSLFVIRHYSFEESMHPTRLIAVLAAILLFSPLLTGETPKPADSTTTISEADAKALDQKIMTEAKANSQIMANLGYLSDIIGPRLTGSMSLKRANDYTAEKMKAYGL